MTDAVDNGTGISYKAVLYTDGGYYASNKAGGWGLHGYVYDDVTLPKGSGSTKIVPSATGYAEPKETADPVWVVNYVDSFGGCPDARDNNHTELIAFKEALSYSLEKGLSETTVYSDSKMVVKGVNEYMPRWKQAGWRTGTGNDVAYKDDWVLVDELLSKHKENQSGVTLTWIKGHNGHLGNEMADDRAGKGNSLGLNGDSSSYTVEEQPEGYWKKAAKYNRIMDHPKWYFSSDEDDKIISDCGRHIYWTGSHGEDEYTGKPQSDSSNAVIYLKEKIDVLEKVRSHFVQQDKKQFGHMFVGALRNIFSPTIQEDILNHGLEVFRKNPVNLSLVNQKKVPVIHHVNPTGLVYYNVGHLEGMAKILDQYMKGDKSLITTDLTDLLYETTEKKGAKSYKLRKTISSTTRHLDLVVNYNTATASELRQMDEVLTKNTKLRLIVGADILGRNAMAALSADIKKVVVLTWRESDTTIRYATVVETEDDIGLWTNPYGNFKLIG